MAAMHLTVHENAAEFLAAAGAFLKISEAENNIVSVSAARMISGPYSRRRRHLPGQRRG